MEIKNRKCFIFILIIVFLLLLNASCSLKITIEEIEASFVSDEYLMYYDGYNKKTKTDFYYVVGQKSETLSNEFYIPYSFNGKEVKQIGFSTRGQPFNFKEELGEWHPTFLGVENLYTPYSMANPFGSWVGSHTVKRIYISSNEVNISDCVNSTNEFERFYVTSKIFDKTCIKYVKIKTEEMIINDYMVSFYDVEDDKIISTIQRANTTFMFNYENSPNEGVFFINNFERGSVIKDVPYKPEREGYQFAGWYKEPACVNAWDFEVDKTPEVCYDEKGELIFIETKLYAKWI